MVQLFRIHHINVRGLTTYPNIHLFIYEFSQEQIPHLSQEKKKSGVNIYTTDITIIHQKQKALDATSGDL